MIYNVNKIRAYISIYLSLSLYIYIYIYVQRYTFPFHAWGLESFMSPDSDVFPRNFRADSSSPQIPTTLFGYFHGGRWQSPQVSTILRKTFTTIYFRKTFTQHFSPRREIEILAREMS